MKKIQKHDTQLCIRMRDETCVNYRIRLCLFLILSYLRYILKAEHHSQKDPSQITAVLISCCPKL